MNKNISSTNLINNIQQFLQQLPNRNQLQLNKMMDSITEQSNFIHLQSQNIQKMIQDINKHITQPQLVRYLNLRKKKNENEKLIQIVEKGKNIMKCVDSLLNATNIDQEHEHFNEVLGLINDFEQVFKCLTELKLQNSQTFRDQFYTKILGKLNLIKGSEEAQFNNLELILTENNLPLKKNDKKKQGLAKQQHKSFILSTLHKQFCINSLSKYIVGLLQKQQQNRQSKCLVIYWKKIITVVEYLFLKENTNTHNIEEPVWMFEYLQITLNINYKYLIDYIVVQNEVKDNILKSVVKYFVEQSYGTLIGTMIQRRFKIDLPNFNPFLIFNFIDELSQFQDKLSFTFNVSVDFLQPLLLRYNKSHNVLQKIFDYEHTWIQQKIFEDFLNINYNNVNLKNLDVFNIVINFTNLFERLFKKYKTIKNQILRSQIQQFYHKAIMDLIAHIKTAFDRIYKYSGLQRIQILKGFKRVENEFVLNLGQFINNNKLLEEEVEKEYYGFLTEYFIDYGLQILNPIHKKLFISLNDIHEKLISIDEQDQHKYIIIFNRIYKDWSNKIEILSQFSSYKDNKLRNIFFAYLESINFSLIGFNFYIKIFESYLKILLNEEGYRILIMLLTMQKQQFVQYVQTHRPVISFLSAEQLKKVQKFKLSMKLE